MASLRLLGGFELLDDGGTPVRLASRKARALLALLALEPGQPQARDRLAGCLWEEVEGELARASLRQALTALRRVLPGEAAEAVLADAQVVTLNPRLLSIDQLAFRAAVAGGTRAALAEAVALYRGELLEGFDARSAAFDDRVRGPRADLHRLALGAVERLAALAVTAGDEPQAREAATRWVALDPLNEEAARVLMSLHSGRGRHAAALEEYRRLREALRRDLSIAPEPATEKLHRQILDRRRLAPAPEPAGTTTATASAPVEEAAVAVRAAGGTGTLNEAAVLAARLSALATLSLDPEEATDLALDFQALVATVASGFGGLVAGDLVGADLVVAFGAERARGNQDEAAVRAALALRRAVVARPWPVEVKRSLRIGLGRGPLARPAVGVARLPLVGATVSAALERAARAPDGAILTGEEIARALGARLRPDPAPTGISPSAGEVLVGELAAPTDAGNAVPMVGRRPELTMLQAALASCRSSGRGGVLVVRGEAGIGKSRLIEAVMGAAAADGFIVAAAQALDFGQRSGRRLITALTLGLLGVGAEAPVGQRSEALSALVAAGAVARGHLVFLHELAEAPLSAAQAALVETGAPADEGHRHRIRAEALGELLRAVATRGPVLLVAEDVHWADADELGLLAHLASASDTGPINLLLSTRPEGDPLGSAWRARCVRCAVTTVDLGPLGTGEARALAEAFVGLDPSARDSCLQRAEGHPLFLEQLLRAAAIGRADLPGSVRAVVLARLEPLAPGARDAACAAAVLGQRFARPALDFVTDGAAHDREALAEAGLVRSAGGEELAFSHALVRDAVYQSLGRSSRQRLHGRAATWFLERDPVLAADHLAAADDPRAPSAYCRAARAELGAHRLERALAAAEKARALASEPPEVDESAGLLGEVQLLLGRPLEALVAHREALEFAGDARRRAELEIGVAGALRLLDRHQEALETLARAESRLEVLLPEAGLHARAISAELARLSTLRGNILFPMGDIETCLAAHEAARAHARRAGSVLDELNALGGLGDAYYQRGQMLTARRCYAECVTTARRLEQTGVLLAHLPMLGITRVYDLDLAGAVADWQEALDLVGHLARPRAELVTRVVMATLDAYRGQPAVALESARAAQTLARKLGARRFEAEGTALAGGALAQLGRRVEGLAELKLAWTLAQQSGVSYCGPAVLGGLAAVTDDPTERAWALREGEALLGRGAPAHNGIDFRLRAIELSLTSGDLAGARRHADLLLELFSEPLPLAQLVARRARALCDLREGRAGAAEEVASVRAEIDRTGLGILRPGL